MTTPRKQGSNSMSIIRIEHRHTGAVLYEYESTEEQQTSGIAMRAAIEAAVKCNANLSGAYLRGINLGGAYLSGVNLSGANLGGANLGGANLNGVNLSGANLSDVNLGGANLSDAYLSGAYLSGANLSGINLSGANLAIAMTRILPDGDLVGWKKCRDGVIVKLRIPADAKRSHTFGRKCRAEFADVLEVIGADVGISLHDGKTEYRVGQRVTPDSFDENWMDECSHGIYFFITQLEAENYSG